MSNLLVKRLLALAVHVELEINECVIYCIIYVIIYNPKLYEFPM